MILLNSNYPKLSTFNIYRNGFKDLTKAVQEKSDNNFSILFKNNKKLSSLQRMVSNAFNVNAEIYSDRDLAELCFGDIYHVFNQQNLFTCGLDLNFIISKTKRNSSYELFLDHKHSIGIGLYYNFYNSLILSPKTTFGECYLIYVNKGYIYLKCLYFYDFKHVNNMFIEIRKQLNNPSALIRLYAECFENYGLKFLSDEEKESFSKRHLELKNTIQEQHNQAEKLNEIYQQEMNPIISKLNDEKNMLTKELKMLEDKIEENKKQKHIKLCQFYDKHIDDFSHYFEITTAISLSTGFRAFDSGLR